MEFVRDLLEDVLDRRRYSAWSIKKVEFDFSSGSFLAIFLSKQGETTTASIPKELVSNILQNNSLANLWQVKRLVRRALLQEEEPESDIPR